VPDYVSVQVAARRLGVAPVTVRRWTASGLLPCVRTHGGHRRISTDDIEELGRAGGRGHLAARRARERELDTLIEVAAALTSQLELPALLREIARAMTLLVDCRFCAVSEYDRQTRTVRSLAEYDAAGERLAAEAGETEYHVREFPATRRALEEQVEVVVNVDDRHADAAEVAALRRGGDKSVLILPLVFSGESIGLIEATDAERTRRYSRQELRLFRAVAGQAAVALHNARVFAALSARARRGGGLLDVLAALTDRVDGLATCPSRRPFLEKLAAAVCDACDALSCVATAGRESAGAVGRGTAGTDRGHILVSAAPTGDGDARAAGITLAVTLPGRPAEGLAELLALTATAATSLWRRLPEG